MCKSKKHFGIQEALPAEKWPPPAVAGLLPAASATGARRVADSSRPSGGLPRRVAGLFPPPRLPAACRAHPARGAASFYPHLMGLELRVSY